MHNIIFFSWLQYADDDWSKPGPSKKSKKQNNKKKGKSGNSFAVQRQGSEVKNNKDNAKGA